MPRVDVIDPQLGAELEAAGQRLAAADAERAEAMEQVRQVVQRGDDQGISVAGLARKVGLSRVSV
ncbi:hypothetical protein, partial [Nocardioides mangrovicus]|uniref:hypothetical protein n=1 Tax=Nocardioides mangrovicus TaxID=2478913 RepID=UPI0018E0A8F5